MTLKQLRAFVFASRSLSFTAAAHQLHLTQSAVSLLIRDLEAALGIRLFERGRKLRLTALGADFAVAAERILVELDLCVANLRNAREAQRGVIRIAVGHLLAATLFPSAISRFTARHPGIRVHLVDCLVEQLPAKVLAGEVDLAIGSHGTGSNTPGLGVELLFRDSIHLASSTAAEVLSGARRGPGVPWQRLQGEPMILVNAGNRIWTTVAATLARRQAQLSVAHQVAIYSTGIALARQGLGRLLLPGFCTHAPALAELAIQPLVEPVIRWDVSMLFRRGAALDAPALDLAHLLAQAADGDASPRVTRSR